MMLYDSIDVVVYLTKFWQVHMEMQELLDKSLSVVNELTRLR